MPSSSVLSHINQFEPVLHSIHTPDQLHSSPSDCLVVGALRTDNGPEILSSPILEGLTLPDSEDLKALGVTGSEEQVVRMPAPEGVQARSLAVVGLGSQDALSQGTPARDQSSEDEIPEETIRRAAGSAVRQLTGIGSVAIALPSETPERFAAVSEGAAMASYNFTSYKSEPSAQRPPRDIIVATTLDKSASQAVLEQSSVVAQAVQATRDLVNTPPSALYPETMAETVVDLVKDLPITAEVWDEKRLEAEGFGGIMGVGQGSSRPPRLVKLDYNPDNAQNHTALIGKGITFDSGGISLKPAGSMLTMKSDMTGAASVTSVVKAAARLNLPIRVTGWLAIAENMPSGTATRPSDVVTMHNGKTVEILNTDAEGRVVMADALSAACEENPDQVLDIATLTGAQMVALGSRTTGVMGHEAVRSDIISAAQEAGEDAWPMPIPAHLRASLDSSVADLTNLGDRHGGMLAAAAFLREFVGSTPWAHLDIAGPSFNESAAWGYTPKDATGVMVRTLLRFLKNK